MSHSEYIRSAEKLARFLTASKITADEYAENLLVRCAVFPILDKATATAVALSVPANVRSRVHEEIEKILAPEYRYPPVQIGGPGPSLERREEIRRDYETRIKASALELSEALESA